MRSAGSWPGLWYEARMPAKYKARLVIRWGFSVVVGVRRVGWRGGFAAQCAYMDEEMGIGRVGAVACALELVCVFGRSVECSQLGCKY